MPGIRVWKPEIGTVAGCDGLQWSRFVVGVGTVQPVDKFDGAAVVDGCRPPAAPNVTLTPRRKERR